MTEIRVDDRPVARYVKCLWATAREQHVEGGGPGLQVGVGLDRRVSRLLDEATTEDDRRAIPTTTAIRSWSVWPRPGWLTTTFRTPRARTAEPTGCSGVRRASIAASTSAASAPCAARVDQHDAGPARDHPYGDVQERQADPEHTLGQPFPVQVHGPG